MKNINTEKKYNENLESITINEFVIAWRKAFHDKRVKPYMKGHGNKDTKYYYETKEKGWLYPEHHIIYNVIRGLPISRGFEENSEGFQDALDFLKHTANFGYGGKILTPFEESLGKDKVKEILEEIKLFLNK